MQIDRIIKDGWYKTATEAEMRTALMHLEMETMDRLSGHLNERYQECRNQCFEECAEYNGWNENS